MHIYVLSKNKVKLGGLEVPFKKNSFGKKNNLGYSSIYFVKTLSTLTP